MTEIKYPIEKAIQLWTSGHKSYLRRLEKEPTDNKLYEVMNLLKSNLAKITIEVINLQQLANTYSEDHFHELYGGEENYRRWLDEFPDKNYVITSTFEDAVYYFKYEELLQNA